MALVLTCISHASSSYALILFQNEIFKTDAEHLLLDANGDASDTFSIQFGSNFAETILFDGNLGRFEISDDLRIEGNAGVIGEAYIANDHAAINSDGNINLGREGSSWKLLKWDSVESTFIFNDSLSTEGNIEMGGQIFTGDYDNSGAGNDFSIISNQGSDNDGGIKYNSTLNYWELSNDGGAYKKIATVQDSKAMQIRRTTSLSLGSSYADVTFNATDIENDTSYLEHDNINTDRILINEDGLYLVSYNLSVDLISSLLNSSSVSARVRVSDASTATGSETSIGMPANLGTFNMILSRNFIVSLSAGDFLTLQLDRTGNAATLTAGATINVLQLSTN